jgi:hypothetical protein
MKQNSTLLVGFLAGIAAGLMLLAAYRAGAMAFFLFFAAPAAIYIATMGWGLAAGITGLISGAVLCGIFGTPEMAGVATLLLLAPAVWIGHLVNLGHKDEQSGKVGWFPLSSILFRLMLALAFGFLVFGFVAGISADVFVNTLVEMMKELGKANPELPQMSDELLFERASAYASLIPMVVPALWLLLHVATAFVAASVTRRSGLLPRQAEDIAANANLPIEATGFIIVGLLGTTLFSDALNLASAVILGIAIAGYGLIGLAQLHLKTRSFPSQGILLAIVYGSIVLFTLPLLVFTVIGIYRSIFNNQTGQSGPTKHT